MAEVRVEIARCGSTEYGWEVRLIGPGGWMTTLSNVDKKEAEHQARAMGVVLGLTYTEHPL